MAVETIEELAKLIYEKAFWGNYNSFYSILVENIEEGGENRLPKSSL